MNAIAEIEIRLENTEDALGFMRGIPLDLAANISMKTITTLGFYQGNSGRINANEPEPFSQVVKIKYLDVRDLQIINGLLNGHDQEKA